MALPAGFSNTGDLPLGGQISEANPADAELADEGAWPSTHGASVILS